MLECRFEQKSVRYVDRFHEIHIIERNSSKRIFVVRGRLTKIQTTSRPDQVRLDAWTSIGKAAQRREKQEWAIEKPKLEHARDLRGVYSIDPSDEYKDVIKNAKRKLETSKAAAMPCKRAFPQSCIRETVVSKTEKAKASEAKTRFSCITEAHESTRQNSVSNDTDS